jgi:hypothetical protein
MYNLERSLYSSVKPNETAVSQHPASCLFKVVKNRLSTDSRVVVGVGVRELFEDLRVCCK